ncbi:MAG: hypothetical protein WD075_07970 [Rhodospirillales bacterium]
MAGLVLQLQSDALDANIKISNLLRKAKVASVKLNIEEVHQWIEHELSGYFSETQVPSYRQIRGSIKFRNPSYGWMPVIFEDIEFENELTQLPIRQSIASLESTIDQCKFGFWHFLYRGQRNPCWLNKLVLKQNFKCSSHCH